MITTARPILTDVSYNLLKESSVTATTARLNAFHSAVNRLLSEHKWAWALKELDLSLVASTQTYDLTSETSDYNPAWGIHEVYSGTTKLDPIVYEKRGDTYPTQRFYLEPDNKNLGFTGTILGTEDYNVWYYQSLTEASVADADTSLNIPLPEAVMHAVALLTQFYVHQGKRQRNDARNALLDYKEEINTLRPQASANKIKGLPKTVGSPLRYSNYRRTYKY